jgi:hypothetical protein
MKIASKIKKPGADDIVIVALAHANERGTFSRGERVRAGTPGLDLSLTVADGTPQSEWPTYWEEDPPPVELGTNVVVQSIEIPAHRRVVSQVDLTVPGRWAPGSIGERAATRPPLFARSVLRRGQIVDILSEHVRANPGDSSSVRSRSRTSERIARLEGGDAAA